MAAAQTATRRMLSGGAPASPFAVFDRAAKTSQRSRAARSPHHSRLADYVKRDVAASMVDRLLDIKRRYAAVVELGGGAGHVSREVDDDVTQRVTLTDASEAMLYRDDGHVKFDVPVERVVMDEEHLTFADDSLDCVLSPLSLHWVNDLPGTLIQIRKALKPDGVFIGAMFGGDTLFELRTALQLAEMERDGTLSPRISPMTDSQSMSSLLGRAGFSIPTVDVDELTIQYPSMWELVQDLQYMGETNSLIHRRPFLKRDVLISAASIYSSMNQYNSSVPATFQIVWCIGWKPHSSQPKPLQRGSAHKSMKDIGQSSNL